MSTPLSSRETYEVVDLNGGDVLAVYSDRAKAIRDAYALVDKHPDMEGDIVVIHFDSRHVRMGYDDILIPIWPAEQTTDRAHDEDRVHGSWIVYEQRIRNAWINRCWRCVWRPFHD